MRILGNLQIKYILGITVQLLLATFVYSQSTARIRLLDQESLMPVQGATFEYGTEKGVSDEDGWITFTPSENLSMKLSHVNYGKWEWDDEEVKEMINQKASYRKSLIVNLYPVTVIALTPDDKPSESMNLGYYERMVHDGAAILNQAPSFSCIRKSGNYGLDPIFRGFKYSQLNIVMNGAQSATVACPNRMDPATSQMAPNVMDHIEVLKGPHALRYGGGFGGTINFVSSKLVFTHKKDIYGRFSTGYESNGEVLRSEGQIGFGGKNHDLGLFTAWSQGNDYKAGNGDTVQSGFQRGSFGMNLGWNITKSQQLRVSAIYNMARDAEFPALPMDLRNDDTWMFNMRHDFNINNEFLKSWNTTVFASFVDHLMDNHLKNLNPRMLNAETAANTYNYGGRTESVWRFSKSTLYAGGDLRLEGAEGIREREFLMGPNSGNILRDNAWQDSRISKTGLFCEYQLNTRVYQFVFSGRLELNNTDVIDPAPEFIREYSETEGTQINPSISMGASRSFNKGFKLGLWLGRAQRSGSLTEKFINYFPVGQDPYEIIGNPQLKPEINNQTDLALEWATDKTKVNIDLFASYLQDLISSSVDTNLSPRIPSSPGVRRFTNTDDAFKTGFEVSWSQEIAFGLQHLMGIAYTFAHDLGKDEPLPEIAPLDFVYTLRGSYFKGKLHPKATFRYVMKQSRISAEFGESTTPSFSLLDVQISYRLLKNMRLGAGVNNLFNENYYEHLTRSVRGGNNPIFARGRNVFASLNIKF